MSSFPRSLLFLALILPSLSAFLESDIRGSYILQYGSSSCGEKLRITHSDLELKAKYVFLESSNCPPPDPDRMRSCQGGGRINLQRDLLVGTAAQLFFGERFIQTGSFLSGPPSTDFICKCVAIRENSVIVMVKPDSAIKDVRWEDVFIGDSVIGNASQGKTENFEQGVKYIIVGSSCFYKQDESKKRAACFPGNARVVVEGGGVKSMSDVRVGDRVQVGPDVYSSVFGWTHRDESSVATFVRVTLNSKEVLVATEGHYVYVQGGVKQMRGVRVGDYMRRAKGGWGTVVSVEWEVRKGIYNPQTVYGDIVVEGVVCTTYTEAIEPAVAHTLLAPLRAAYAVLGNWNGWRWVVWSELWHVS